MSSNRPSPVHAIDMLTKSTYLLDNRLISPYPTVAHQLAETLSFSSISDSSRRYDVGILSTSSVGAAVVRSLLGRPANIRVSKSRSNCVRQKASSTFQAM